MLKLELNPMDFIDEICFEKTSPGITIDELVDNIHFGRSCNIIIENEVITKDSKAFWEELFVPNCSEKWMKRFGINKISPINYLPPTTDMFDILVALNIFPSKGQAAKNWKLTGKAIPLGWSQFLVAKHKPTRVLLYIFNPIVVKEESVAALPAP